MVDFCRPSHKCAVEFSKMHILPSASATDLIILLSRCNCNTGYIYAHGSTQPQLYVSRSTMIPIQSALTYHREKYDLS